MTPNNFRYSDRLHCSQITYIHMKNHTYVCTYIHVYAYVCVVVSVCTVCSAVVIRTLTLCVLLNVRASYTLLLPLPVAIHQWIVCVFAGPDACRDEPGAFPREPPSDPTLFYEHWLTETVCSRGRGIQRSHFGRPLPQTSEHVHVGTYVPIYVGAYVCKGEGEGDLNTVHYVCMFQTCTQV